jgi:diketogulonate reductase-like aldo/keto reductase
MTHPTPGQAPAVVAPGLVTLETAGVQIPRIGLGTFRTTSDEARTLVRHALEAGYRHVDTAMRYENEPGVGQGVRDSSVPRSEIFVTTKFPHTLAAAGDVVEAAWESLRALGVVRAVGLSNAPAALVRRALGVTRLATVQVEHHPYLPQDTLHELVMAEGMTLTAYAPFAEGRVFTDPVLTAIAAKHGTSAGQVTLRWLLRRPRTVVIPKTSRPDRLTVNLDVAGIELDADDVARIDALGAARQRFFDPPWQSFAWDER